MDQWATRSLGASARICIIASTSPLSGAVSDWISVWKVSPSRTDMIAMPWSPIVPLTSTASPGRALRRADVHAGRDDADAGCVDVNPVAVAFLHHLGIAGGDLHAGFFAGLRHGGDDVAQCFHRQALFQDEAGREEQRLRPAHGQVIDRAIDGQFADIPAGEEQRADHERIGRESQPG